MEEGGISELPQYSGDLRKGEASFWKRGGGDRLFPKYDWPVWTKWIARISPKQKRNLAENLKWKNGNKKKCKRFFKTKKAPYDLVILS